MLISERLTLFHVLESTCILITSRINGVSVIMFPQLNSILDISQERPPNGQFILVTESKADATFVLHHLSSLYLRGDFGVCFVALSHAFNHYRNVGNKLGVDLNKAKDSGKLVFIEGLKSLGGSILDGSDNGNDILDSDFSLRPLYEQIKLACTSFKNCENLSKLVVVDDLSILLSLGVPVDKLVSFVHNLREIVCPTKESLGCLAVHVPVDRELWDDSEEFLLKSLSYKSDCIISAYGLRSGYCKDVHGEVRSIGRFPGHKLILN